MRHYFVLATAATIACSSALAQTPLSAYVDSNGFTKAHWPKPTPPSILPPGHGTWQPPGVKQVS